MDAKQLDELIDFSVAPQERLSIREQACDILLSLSTQPIFIRTLEENPLQRVGRWCDTLNRLHQHLDTTEKQWMTLLLKLLINVTAQSLDLARVVLKQSWNTVCGQVLMVQPQFAELNCMLLANLCKCEESVERMTSVWQDGILVVDMLITLFVRGKRSDFSHLANVFADVSRTDMGRRYFLSKNAAPLNKLVQTLPLDKIMVRRAGICATVKNCCFDMSAHDLLFEMQLPVVLIKTLTGHSKWIENETQLDLEVNESIRLMILESLQLLASRRSHREQLRALDIYPLIRETHKLESSSAVIMALDQMVQLLMRDETKATYSCNETTASVEEEVALESLLDERELAPYSETFVLNVSKAENEPTLFEE